MRSRHARTRIYGLIVSLILAGCGQQVAENNSDFAAAKEIPATIGQALAVVSAQKDLGITPQNSKDMWVVSTLIFDPLMRPAFWANLIVKGQEPTNFWSAVTTAKAGDLVYLTGAATNRTFNGDIFPVELFQKLNSECSSCRLLIYSHSLFGVKGNTWVDWNGVALSSSETNQIREAFTEVAKGVESSDIPREMGKRWERLLDETPGGVPNPLSNLSQNQTPILNIGTQFFRARATTGGVKSQTTDSNNCTQWFMWSCTVRVISGSVSTLSYFDFGNYQQITNSIGWNSSPNQNYYDPSNAPSQVGTNTVWGDWDQPSPASLGLLVGTDYLYGQYLVGCGAMSVARLLDWTRATGKLGSRFIKLPNDSLGNSGYTIGIDQSTPSSKFMKMVFWPVKVGERLVNGVNKKVYASWLPEKMGSTFYSGQTNTTVGGVINGANSWLADNGWSERIVGAYSRDWDLFSIVGMALPPAFSFVPWSQATWGVNGTLKASIGAATVNDEMPAIIGYQTGLNNITVNGIHLGGGHYALAKQFTVVEYWDWSENYATVNWPAYNGDVSYWKGTSKVYLSDYYDMMFAAFRLQR